MDIRLSGAHGTPGRGTLKYGQFNPPTYLFHLVK
jgi:hypothetical protein